MKKIRIGSGLGFYGDSWAPIRATIERGHVNYIASDHLAELTLAILQKDRLKDSESGFTKDLVPMLTELYPLAKEKGIKFVLNAGGLNPLGAQKALAAAFEKQGLKAKIIAVTGDALSERLDELAEKGVNFKHLDTNQPIDEVRDRILFVNAYLGAKPLVEALEQGADIVLTGRVADAALFLAPMIYEFGWSFEDYDKLAQGITIGHLLECSGQGSGGNYGGKDWAAVPAIENIGYPIAEVYEDSTAIITKAEGTGGRVNVRTVSEQLLYETHNPRRYYSPDVIVDMGTIALKDVAEDQVHVSGATGLPAPQTLKVLAGYDDGYLAQGIAGYAWPDALKKAEVAAHMIKSHITRDGYKVEDIHVEYMGYNALHGPLSHTEGVDNINEIFMRIAIKTYSKGAARKISQLVPHLFLSGPPFVTIVPTSGVRGLLGIFPTLIERQHVEPFVQIHAVEV